MRWQFDATAAALFTLNDTINGFTVNSAVRAQYVIADRWLAVSRIFQNRIIYQPYKRYGNGDAESEDSWSIRGDVILSYFLEDRWALSAQTAFGHYNTSRFDERQSKSFELSIGLSYGPGASFFNPYSRGDYYY